MNLAKYISGVLVFHNTKLFLPGEITIVENCKLFPGVK